MRASGCDGRLSTLRSKTVDPLPYPTSRPEFSILMKMADSGGHLTTVRLNRFPPGLLVPLPSAFLSAVPVEDLAVISAEDRWANRLRAALARCPADRDGWVELSELGTELKSSKIKVPKGKLSEVVRRVEGIECRGANAKALLRLRNDGLPSASLEEPPFVPDFSRFDDEIPF